MTAYWTTCDGCTYCTTADCTAVAYCDNEPHHGPAHCDAHTPPQAAS